MIENISAILCFLLLIVCLYLHIKIKIIENKIKNENTIKAIKTIKQINVICFFSIKKNSRIVNPHDKKDIININNSIHLDEYLLQ